MIKFAINEQINLVLFFRIIYLKDKVAIIKWIKDKIHSILKICKL